MSCKDIKKQFDELKFVVYNSNYVSYSTRHNIQSLYNRFLECTKTDNKEINALRKNLRFIKELKNLLIKFDNNYDNQNKGWSEWYQDTLGTLDYLSILAGFPSLEIFPSRLRGQESCAICMNNLGKSRVHLTTCKHEFDAFCLFEWLSRNDTCPICRAVN